MADSLYADCIQAADMGSDVKETITLSPIDPACQKICDTDCKSFSRKTAAGQELNETVIMNCQSECQAGRTTNLYYREEVITNSVKQIKVRGPIPNQVSCTSTMTARPSMYTSKFNVVSGDTVKLMMLVTDIPNKVYMCGRKGELLIPNVKLEDSSKWFVNTTPQTAMSDRADSICAMQMQDGAWANATNASLWSPADNSKCKWSAKNNVFTDAEIWIKNGDELSLKWGGNFMNYTTAKIKNLSDLYKAYKNPSQYDVGADQADSLIYSRSAIDLIPGGINSLDYIAPASIFGETARVSKWGSPQNVSSSSTPIKWNGLTGLCVDAGSDYTVSSSAPFCDSFDKQVQNYDKCVSVKDPGVPTYIFSGILEDFSVNPTRLAVRHHPIFNVVPPVSIGGFDLEIKWGGCPLEDGAGMQYTISDSIPDDTTTWMDITEDMLQDKTLPITSSGKIFVRFKPISAPNIPSYAPSWVADLYKDPANRFGQYTLGIAKLDSDGLESRNGPISQLVNTVRDVLYGKDGKAGVVETLYTNLFKQTQVVTIIRVILLLFISFTAFGYLVGTLQMTQQDMIARLFKLAFISVLISDTSWKFFYDTFFKFFMDGGLELIAYVTAGSLTSSDGSALLDVSSDPAAIFSFFDKPFKMLFTEQVWKKIAALMLSGVFGFIFAFIIIVAVVFYTISIAMAIFTFLMSIVSISLLIVVAPVFLSFMLFKFTKSMFDMWWKFLLSFMLQPVAMFTSIAIFNILFFMSLSTALGFTVCPSCFLEINLPFIDRYCAIPAWQILFSLHAPSSSLVNMYIPINTMQAAILCLLIAQGMYAFSGKILDITNMIVIGGMIYVATLGSHMRNASQSFKSVVGRDMHSINRRMMSERKENEHTQAAKFKAEEDKKEAAEEAKKEEEKKKKEEKEKEKPKDKDGKSDDGKKEEPKK
jgi:type IV secretion system protein VirB6